MEKTHPSAIWSFITTVALVCLGAYLLGGFEVLCSQFPLLFTDPQGLDNSGSAVGTVFASALLSVFFSIVSGLTIYSLLGSNNANHAVRQMLEEMEGRYNFFIFFVVVVAEELFARWLFLGVLPQYLNSNLFVFYTLLFGGNLLWSMLHLLNFRDGTDRQFIKILPQFLAGLVYSFVYLKFGLLATIIVHFADNSLLLSLHKVEDAMPNKDFWIGAYSLLMALLSVTYLNYWSHSSPWEMSVWLNRDSGFAIEGWNFWDYLAGSLAIGYGLRMLGVFCCYDHGFVEEDGESQELPSPLLILTAIILIVVIGLTGYWLMGIFSSNVHCRALLLTISLCFFYRSNSGSGVVRNFWVMLPTVYIVVCTMEAVGFFLAVAILGLHLVSAVPVFLLQRKGA